MAMVLAQAVGQPLGRQAASHSATVGGGEECPRNRRVPRGPPDARTRPHVPLLLIVLIVGRREESSLARLWPASISSAGAEEGGVGARDGSGEMDVVMVSLMIGDIAAAALTPVGPPPPTLSPVEGGRPGTTTMPRATSATATNGPPSNEAEGGTGWVVMTMAAIPVTSAAAVVMMAMTATTMDGLLWVLPMRMTGLMVEVAAGTGPTVVAIAAPMKVWMETCCPDAVTVTVMKKVGVTVTARMVGVGLGRTTVPGAGVGAVGLAASTSTSSSRASSPVFRRGTL